MVVVFIIKNHILPLQNVFYQATALKRMVEGFLTPNPLLRPLTAQSQRTMQTTVEEFIIFNPPLTSQTVSY